MTDKNKNIRLLVELSIEEASVVKMLRDTEFGEVTIIMHDGAPQRYVHKKTQLFSQLDAMQIAEESGNKINGILHEPKV